MLNFVEAFGELHLDFNTCHVLDYLSEPFEVHAFGLNEPSQNLIEVISSPLVEFVENQGALCV